MAFDLKRVLKVMLFASNGPLSVKDVQTAITRFHEQASALPLLDEEAAEAPVEVAPTPAPEAEVAPEATVAAEAPVAEEATRASASEIPADGAGEGEPTVPVAPVAVEPILPVLAEDDESYINVPTLVTAADIREAMEAISLELRANDSEMVIVESSNGWRLATQARFAKWVRLLRNEPPPVRLTASALETLAVVAYRQPVTRGEIEQIRGVSAEAGITKLLERDLVYIVGRADLPGRPIQYGTTDGFLEFVGIKSLDELPASDVLSPRQIDAWLQTSNTPRPMSDGDVGLDETEEDQLSLQPTAAAAPESAEATPETPAS